MKQSCMRILYLSFFSKAINLRIFSVEFLIVLFCVKVLDSYARIMIKYPCELSINYSLPMFIDCKHDSNKNRRSYT